MVTEENDTTIIIIHNIYTGDNDNTNYPENDPVVFIFLLQHGTCWFLTVRGHRFQDNSYLYI